MTVQGQLKEMLKTVAVTLGDELRARLVFVGGCTTALYITDPITLEGVRATDDVDLIVDLAGFAEWAELMDQLRERGFTESAEDNVILPHEAWQTQSRLHAGRRSDPWLQQSLVRHGD
jgi:hypothetical protein